MQKLNTKFLYSASDIVNFLDCEHLTVLDLMNLETPLPKAEDDEEALLYMHKGIAHEASYLQHLHCRGLIVADVSQHSENLEEAFRTTRSAMDSGADIIFQATLKEGNFIGHADFLRRVPRPSALGDYSYEVLDTKLSRRAKAAFLVQLCFYSELLTVLQGSEPHMMHVILGDRREESFRYADYSRYYRYLKKRFLDRIDGGQNETYPDPCDRCDICRWRLLCEDRRIKDDHLCQVAGITKLQIRKLAAENINTLEVLGALSPGARVARMAQETLDRLRSQAALQLKRRKTGEDHFEILPLDPLGKRGFYRLPEPDGGDIFFDIEGDPLEEGGLDYLFGVYYFDEGEPCFRSFWGHSREEEREAFESYMDFVGRRLKTFPRAHIYHYAHYESTALKRLMSLHGTRENEVDNLLRTGKLVDLYRVVRESLRVSEPSYSIKNMERFYMPSRTGSVQSAGASIVFYERWRETGDESLLRDIEAYNRDDLVSNFALREWLLEVRPSDAYEGADADVSDEDTVDISEMNETELRLARYRELLIDPLPDERDSWVQDDHLKELAFQLLDFHRRSEKPVWWSFFSRRDMTAEELIEDVEAIGGMELLAGDDPAATGRKRTVRYTWPEQDTKLKTGDNCVITDSLIKIKDIVIDEDNRLVSFTWPGWEGEPQKKINIGGDGPLQTKVLRDALFRFADTLTDAGNSYEAVTSALYQDCPRIDGRSAGEFIIDESKKALPQVIDAVAGLNNGHVFIQGPPGSGKTWIGARVIAELVKRGFRVGVSSNSHKAINHLLREVERVAKKKKISFSGAKKAFSGNPDSFLDGDIIVDVTRNDELLDDSLNLVAGTAWLFSRDEFDRSFDYLFVDEAGQVSLANLIAMGTCARNIVLMGDQMQLGQPIQGVHPGRSGESSLEYLLNGMATIPPDRGIFLKTTWRMHENVCRFISDAVYDGRLEPKVANNRQGLVLSKGAHRSLRETGIVLIPAEHEGCSQQSEEEANTVRTLYNSLLKQKYRDRRGTTRPITSDNILIVAPYNMQVNLLKRTLPKNARVGTVDKFQGQEAEVIIVSMVTSSGNDLPRHIEFLYSKNRLNVAISRAKCLAVLVANPALMAIRCRTPEQMALVNTLCWVKEYSDGQGIM